MASYGSPITAEQAKKAAALALAEARKNNWTMAAAVVDPAGVLVYFEKIDDTQHASSKIAIDNTGRRRRAAARRRQDCRRARRVGRHRRAGRAMLQGRD
jgi:uncharacterized protein GlcG (DUF336 family)